MSNHKENLGQNTQNSVSVTEQPKWKYYASQVGQLVVALLVVFAIRSSIVEPFKIPSGSMIPTLHVGDFIFVNKFAYGFRLPFSDYFGSQIQLIKRDPPKRGDIIVFLFPKDESIHYIKRVVGVPGDTVEIRNKVIYINGAKVESSEVAPDYKTATLKNVGDNRYGDDHIKMYKEKFGEKEHEMMIDTQNEYTSDFGPITIPEERLFVMGDNRDFSNDSRFWGYVPFENVSGRAELIWLSLWINFSDPSKSSFKPSRIGTVLR